jgi:RNA polymerase sigma-70 factor (ECF subfamily)
MQDSFTKETPPQVPGVAFPQTQWSVVLRAKGDDTAAVAALEALCRTYWPPIYASLRRRGFSPPDAEDTTQELFARLLARDFLEQIQQEKGKFRTFLLVSLRNLFCDEKDKARAEKRGGNKQTISIDFQDAEQMYSLEPASARTPEDEFERRWASTLLDTVMRRLSEECIRAKKAELFRELYSRLAGNDDEASTEGIAHRLGMTAAAVRVALHRLRQRYADLLRTEISRTVADPNDVEEELRHLQAVFQSKQ